MEVIYDILQSVEVASRLKPVRKIISPDQSDEEDAHPLAQNQAAQAWLKKG